MSAPLNLREAARLLAGEVSGGQILCPAPGHSRRNRSLSVKFTPGAPDGFIVNAFAPGANWAECRDHVKRALGIDDGWRARPARPAAPVLEIDAPRDADERNIRFAASIVRGMVRLHGSPGEAYLRDARGIDTEAVADVLERTDAIGWHPACLFLKEGHALHGKRLGAIIGVMTDPATGEPTGGISRTYVHEGRKVVKAQGLGPAGIIRLSEDADVLSGLHIGEGLETCLAGMSIGLRPMWAFGSCGAIAKFPVLSGIEALTLLEEHDEASAHAVEECAARWHAAGREVLINRPRRQRPQ